MKPIRNSANAIIIENEKVLLTKNVDKAGYFYLFPGGGFNSWALAGGGINEKRDYH